MDRIKKLSKLCIVVAAHEMITKIGLAVIDNMEFFVEYAVMMIFADYQASVQGKDDYFSGIIHCHRRL